MGHRVAILALGLGLGCSFDGGGAQAGSVGEGSGASSGGTQATSGASRGSGSMGEGGSGPGSTTLPEFTTGPPPPGQEDCLNGVDDNDDGLVDCEDEACKPDYTCVPTVPAGFEGFFDLTLSPIPGAMAPGVCESTGLDAVRFWNGPQGHSCDPCSCGDLSGATCGRTELLCDTDAAGCGSVQDMSGSVPSNGSCTSEPFSATLSMSCRLGQTPVANAGSCEASGGGEQVGSAFAAAADLCGGTAPAGAGCEVGQVCAPRALVDGPMACVVADGDQACPPGWDGKRDLIHRLFDDNRACSACSCSPLTSCSDASYRFWDHNGCSDDIENVNSGTCNDAVGALLDSSAWSVRQIGSPSPSGSCTSDGGEAIGAVTPQDTTTVCCI